MSPGKCDELICVTGVVPGSQEPLCLLLPNSPLFLVKISLGYIHVRIHFHRHLEVCASSALGIGLRQERNRDLVLEDHSQHKLLRFPRPLPGSLVFLCPEARDALRWINPVSESTRILPRLNM